jgi:hypothetical protein
VRGALQDPRGHRRRPRDALLPAVQQVKFAHSPAKIHYTCIIWQAPF